jgi:hypothetical protein
MATRTDALEHQPAESSVNRRLDEIAWALLLILTGAVWLLPERRLPGLWLIGVGIIIFGLGAVRHYRGMKVSGFTLIVGSLALISGLTTALAVELPLFALVLIILGAGLLFRPWFHKREPAPPAHPPLP